MSGAAVWVGRRVVAVIARHYPRESTARLTAVRLDVALAPDALRYAEVLAHLPTVTGSTLELMPDVVPPSASTLALTAYHEQLIDIAPDELIGREPELDELVRFCAGDEPYTWWQADPWAGKTALLSWFALHPPAEVHVVSFFITTRYASQSDSDAYTEALIEQLAALTGEPIDPLRTARARSGNVLRLLRLATEAAHAVGRRLLLVVDGLDEDTSDSAGLPSIASLLPSAPAPGLRVLLASRRSPGVPSDVKGTHPIRKIVPRVLPPSVEALDVALRAKKELIGVLRGPPLHQDVAGLITASGGGLTLSDLVGLTREPPYKLEPLLGGVFGRTVAGRASLYAPAARTGERVYLFAHETLRKTALEQFGNQLHGYRDRLHAWADENRDNGWPPGTPTYLLRGYVRMLVAAADVPRLLALATDHTRHDRMLELTGGDALALTEIATVVDLVRREATPHLLGDLLVLSYTTERLNARNANIPENLPAVWQQLGSPARALALGEGIKDPWTRARALCALIPRAADEGDRTLLAASAQKAIREFPGSKRRAEVLAALARALATAGEHDRAAAIATHAEQVAHEIPDRGERARALAALAAGLATGAEHERAEQVARDIPDPDERARALTALAGALAAAGEHDRAAATATHAIGLAHHIPDPRDRARALTALAGALAAAGEHDHAAATATHAIGLAHHIPDPRDRARALTALAGALATIGEHNRAEQLALDIPDPEERAGALTALAGALATAGEHDRAAATATRAEQLARDIPDPEERAGALTALAGALAAAGEHDRAAATATHAEQLARKIPDLNARSAALTALAGALAAAGEHDRAAATATYAGQVARDIPDPDDRAAALTALVEALATTGEHDRADQIARDILDPFWRSRALAALAGALASTGEHDRADQIARDIPDPSWRSRALIALVEALARTGEHNRADQIARGILDPFWRSRALAALAEGLATTGEHNRADQIARDIPDPSLRSRALTALVEALATTGEHDRAAATATHAEQVARGMTDPYHRAGALAALAGALATTGQHDRAERVAREISELDDRADALIALAGALTAAGQHDRAAATAADAEQVAREIPDVDDRADTLAALAGVLATAGEHDRAGQIAREIPEYRGRVEALLGLARRLAAPGRSDVSRSGDSGSLALSEVLAELMALDWSQSLSILSEVDGRALVALADHIRADSEPI